MTLNTDALLAHVDEPGLQRCLVLDETHSTNDYLLAHADQFARPSVVLTDHQTQGRGRQGRTWEMSKGSGLALSMIWKSGRKRSLSGLTLAVGVMVVRALNRLGTSNLQLKWPNDVLHGKQKLCGILVDVQQTDVIIGIGVNCQLPDHPDARPWTDLHTLLQAPVDPNRLAAQLINELLRGLNDFDASGLTSFLHDWSTHDLLRNQSLTLTQNGRTISGRYQGINEDGALLLQQGQTTTAYYSGDAHIGSVSKA